MTPKEKALELRDKFRIFVGTSKGDEGETINNYLVGKKEAKLGAIMLCDEILSILDEKYQQLSHNNYSKDVIGAEGGWWKKVKTEIENL